jgi:hypothetical protein
VCALSPSDGGEPNRRGGRESVGRRDHRCDRRCGDEPSRAARSRRGARRRTEAAADRGARGGRTPGCRAAGEGLGAPRSPLRRLWAGRSAPRALRRGGRLSSLSQPPAGRGLWCVRGAPAGHLAPPRRLVSVLALQRSPTTTLRDLRGGGVHRSAGQRRGSRRLQPLLPASGRALWQLWAAEALLLRRCRPSALLELCSPPQRTVRALRRRASAVRPLARRTGVRALLSGCARSARSVRQLREGASSRLPAGQGRQALLRLRRCPAASSVLGVRDRRPSLRARLLWPLRPGRAGSRTAHRQCGVHLCRARARLRGARRRPTALQRPQLAPKRQRCCDPRRHGCREARHLS